MKHCDSNTILSPFQHGFRRNRSCEKQLVQFNTDIANILAADKQTDVLVIDFSKAFDKVGHGRLLHKLGHYGVRGRTHRYICRGFHSGSTQEVVVEGQQSDKEPVTSGVPQGAVLVRDFSSITLTRREPVEGKSSVCLICMKYRIIILIIIIISLGQIL